MGTGKPTGNRAKPFEHWLSIKPMIFDALMDDFSHPLYDSVPVLSVSIRTVLPAT
jgi:hypothetical protein